MITTATVRPNGDGDDQSDKPKPRSKGGRRRSGQSIAPQPVTWQHDPGKWGTPRQSWTAPQKILWTMYVALQEVNARELGGPTIADTFNTSFRQFGPLHKNSMPRDLGSLKKKTPAQVMDNPTSSPITWYLTDEGIKEAEKLVIEAKGGPSAPAP